MLAKERKVSHKVTQYFFPLISGIVFLLLFWLVITFIYREVNQLVYWLMAGFVLGVVNGIALQKFLNLFSVCQTARSRNIFFTTVLLIEFAVGVLLIGPIIWIQLRFIPTSNVHSICCQTPQEYGANSYDKVNLTTADGATIAGWYVPPGSQKGKVIILIHGYGYDRRGTDFQTRILIAAGYGVFLYDLRDHGESEAKGALNSFNRMHVYAEDLLQVINYLKQKSDVNQLGVVGISLGAFTALNSKPEILNSFSALWLDGLRFENFGAQLPLITPRDYFKWAFDHQTRWLASLYPDQFIAPSPPTFEEIIPTITRPTLMLVSSGLDESERSTNEKLIPLLNDRKELWIIEKAWHIGGKFEVPDEYRQKMLAFFEDGFNTKN